MTDLTVSLAQLARDHLAHAGGKAANLGELVRAGLPVPPGFCLATAAYRKVAATPDVRAAISGNRPAADVRAALLAAPVPADVVAALTTAYAALGPDVIVAVRSSATAEDLPDASFAGQQDTILGVCGPDALLAAVRRCWASLFTDRAVHYREQRAIAADTVELAVVVQVLVPASVAGVLFTADPVTGRRQRTVIDASPGLGEAVVSGAVNPDHFELEHGIVLTRKLGDKRLRIDADAHGTRQTTVTADLTPCLTDPELHALTALGLRIATHFGAPQDIEWALDAARRPQILQARPITTLYPLPTDAPPAPALSVYFNFNVAQGVPQPLTPMGVQMWRLFTGSVFRAAGLPIHVDAGPPFIKEAGHRLVFDITAALRNRVGRRLAFAVLSRMEARSAAVLARVLEDPRLSLETGGLTVPRAALRALWRTRMPLRVRAALRDPATARADAWQRAAAVLAAGETTDPGTAARLAAIERMFVRDFAKLFLAAMPVMLAGALSMLAIRRLLRGLATPAEIEVALRALPHNPTTEMDLELWAASRRLAADPEAAAALRTRTPAQLARDHHAGTLPPVLREVLSNFLATHGARGIAEIDVGVARWGEDPTHVLGILSNYLAHHDPTLAADVQFERGRLAAEAMISELITRARAHSRLRARLLTHAFTRMRALFGMREAPKLFIVRLLARAREHLQAIASTLVAADRLETIDDVFMLDLPTLRDALAGADLRPLVRARRITFKREQERRHVPRVYLSDGTDAEALFIAPLPAGALTGTPASAGSVTGRARVITDPAGARIEPGEILVAPSTDPGWTPLFLTAGGLVMEMGGAMSHGAVVAREYGIPAVVGVPGATTAISSGQRITVDGSAGTVTVEPEPPDIPDLPDPPPT